MTEGVAIHYREDASLTEQEDSELRRLLFSCFPHEPLFLKRRYLKERPLHRWLVSDGGRIIAHSAVHEKILGSASGEIRIGGIAEVCVSTKHRGRGLAKEMLNAIHAWLPANGIAFAVLFGHPRVYLSSGYSVIRNELSCENALLRQLNPFGGKPMVRRLTEAPWPAGLIDLRGPSW